MKKTFFWVLSVFLLSCNDEKKEAETKAPEPPKALPEFAYKVDRANWSIGDPNNTKLVLDMYQAWDQKDGGSVAGFFADSANMDMPDGRRLALNKSNVYEKFSKARIKYDNTSNKIVLAISLHNDEYNEDWVQIMTYNKWEYKDGVKDSMLYFDNWRLVNGKINYLNSLQQTPPRLLLKTLENK